MIEEFEVEVKEFEDLVILTLKHPQMKRIKIMKAYHQDSDEMVVELKNFSAEEGSDE